MHKRLLRRRRPLIKVHSDGWAVSRQQRSENAPTENAATATPNRRATEVAATNPMAQPVADATQGSQINPLKR